MKERGLYDCRSCSILFIIQHHKINKMKTILSLLIAATSATSAIAQTSTVHSHGDSLMGRWVIDINLLGGLSNQNLTTNSSATNYPGALNMNTGNLKYKNGYGIGADAQLGVFFGKKKHFGLGTGIMFMQQYGDAILDNYHSEFKSTDAAGNVFRQVVNGNDVRESIKSTNINIPLVLKYKNRFSKHWGFTADAGALFNVQMKNAYTTHASFDYEAIYKFIPNEGGGLTSVYDNSPVASTNDWFITRAEFLRNNPNGNVQQYFDTKRALGYSVGSGLTPATTKGSTSYSTGSIGLLLQPSINYFFSDKVALNLGVYYMYQPFKNNAQADYKLTTGISNYSSVTNSVSESKNQNYGVNVGVRFFMGKKDRDHDGVSDKKDKCPDVFGLAKFNGCPDTDGDGIPDDQDSCVLIPGLAKFNGCPDTDGDGTPDKTDECPLVAGPISLHGCPDRDGDGIVDKDDQCPDVPGSLLYHGCPDTDGDGVIDKDDKCPTVAGPASNQGCPEEPVKATPVEPIDNNMDISTPILFDVNMTTIHESSYPLIEKAATELNRNKNMNLTIDGHADATGPESINKPLSLGRANAVKTQLVKRGVSAKRIRAIGHGSSEPAASNRTHDGKQDNRRAVMTITNKRK